MTEVVTRITKQQAVPLHQNLFHNPETVLNSPFQVLTTVCTEANVSLQLHDFAKTKHGHYHHTSGFFPATVILYHTGKKQHHIFI